jgi:hypothetical protein
MTEEWIDPVDLDEWCARGDVLEIASRWSTSRKGDDDGLINWRNYLAVALRTVDPDSAGEGLVRVIPEMETLTTARSIACYDDDPAAFSRFGFQEWLPHWQEHFRHWTDPVRTMLSDLCVTTEAKFFAKRLHAVDGEVLLDFLLCTCCSSLRFFLKADLYEFAEVPGFPLSLDTGTEERMIAQLCRELYNRFREVAPFPTAPSPERIDLSLNYDRLCPKKIDDGAHYPTKESAPQ